MNNKDKFIKPTFYEGGKKAMDEFVQKNLQYPKIALEKKIEGVVHLFLDIDKNGKVVKAKLVKGIGNGCDDEAIRVAKLMQWKVDKVRNMHIVYHQKLSISFKVNEKPSIDLEDVIQDNQIEVQQTITYSIVSAAPVDTSTSTEKPKIVYTYSL